MVIDGDTVVVVKKNQAQFINATKVDKDTYAEAIDSLYAEGFRKDLLIFRYEDVIREFENAELGAMSLFRNKDAQIAELNDEIAKLFRKLKGQKILIGVLGGLSAVLAGSTTTALLTK